MTAHPKELAEGLPELLRLAELATPGSFAVQYGTNVMAGDGWSATGFQSNQTDTQARNTANAEFLVAAANWVRPLAARFAVLEGQNDRMRIALSEVHAYLSERSDVVDGDYGQPMPNEEMTLLREVRAAIAATRDANQESAK